LFNCLLLSYKAYEDSNVNAIVFKYLRKYPLAVLALHSYKVKVHFS